MSSVGELLRLAHERLDNSNDAAADAQSLLSHVLEKDRTWLFTWGDQPVPEDKQTRFLELLEQRAAGTPIAHITGTRAFWTLDLQVTADTLIPRPETEHLVEKALQLGDADRSLAVLDLGTGSGAIALALASENPDWQITASDRSQPALTVAQTNAQQLQLRNIEFVLSDWFSNLQGQFDLVISNPPYIPEDDNHLRQGDLRFEPRQALSSGPDGLDDIRHIAKTAPEFLKPGGWLLLEHGFDQAPAVREILQENGLTKVFSETDLAGHERISGGEIPT